MKKLSRYMTNALSIRKTFDIEKRFFFVILFALSVLIIFAPMVNVTTSKISVSVGLFGSSFFPIIVLDIILLLALRGRNFHSGVRQFIHVIFGFKDNDYLLNFGFLLTLLGSLLSIGSTVSISDIATSALHTTIWYSVTIILLFILLLSCLYLMFKEARVLNKANFMSIIRRKKTSEENQETVKSLFDDENE